MPDHLENPVGDEDRRERCLFRESTASDETAVREILREANLSFHSSNDTSSESDSPALAVIGATFVCELDGEVVAVLQWRHSGEEAEILDVAVPASNPGKC